jgi:homoserine kinase
MSKPVRAYAPGSMGNVGPGLDILGLALTGAGDAVRAEWSSYPGVVIRETGHPDLSPDPFRNSAGVAAAEVLHRAGLEGRGIALCIEKGLPLSGGQGGSAASAVAAAVAVNALAGSPLDEAALLAACLAAETAVAGRHLDNVAPALLGGLVLIRSLEPLDIVRLPTPADLRIVLALPAQQLRTKDARAVLPRQLLASVALHQAAHVGALVAAVTTGDYALLGRALDDRIAEPVRAPLLPGFSEAKAAALEAGAFGASIAGSGPTAFAFARGDSSAEEIAAAMAEAYEAKGIGCLTRIAEVDRQGARLEQVATVSRETTR